MKDLFSGSFGRLNNHGGSRMFTTPNTIYVPPEYEIETDVPSIAEFVTCSLDGRLWVWKRSRRYYVAAFRWNEEIERLEFVNTTILNSETLIKRGVDWILTDKSLILSSDDEPYITRTEYESDDTTYIDAIDKSYSFFPELETWEEIQNVQISNIEGSPSNTWKEIPQSLITPLEFHYYNDDDIQAFTDFNPKLCYCNGQLYGKGKAHIGMAYLLPRTFNDNGEPTNFYLYISPDYLRKYDSEKQAFDDNDGWDKLTIAPLNDSSVCIFTPENNDNPFCKKAVNAQVLSLPQNETLDFSADNGAIFFDVFTHSNLVLNDKKTLFLYDNLSYECKGLRQWLATTGKVEAITHETIISSFNNATLATHIQQGFHRELLNKKTLPLSVKYFLEKRISLYVVNKENRKIIQYNSLREKVSNESLVWQNIYKAAIEIRQLSYLPYLYYSLNWISPHPIFYWKTWIDGINYNKFVYPNPETGEILTSSIDVDVDISSIHIPEEILSWQSTGQGFLLEDLKQNGTNLETAKKNPDFWFSYFSEPHTKIFFRVINGYHVFVTNHLYVYDSDSDYYCNLDVKTFFDINSFNRNVYTRALHWWNSFGRVKIYRSEYHPEIFDFNAELERSKFS